MAVDPVTLAIAASIVTILAFAYIILFGQRSIADLVTKWWRNRKRNSENGDLGLAKKDFLRQEYERTTKRLEQLQSQPGLDKGSRADALLLLGIAEAYSGELDKAIRHGEEVLSVLRALDDASMLSGEESVAIGEAFSLIGYVWRLHGEWSRALDFYNKSLEFSKEDREKAGVLNDIGNVYRLRGDFDRALTYCKHSLVIRKREKSEKPEGLALSLNTLGMAYRDAGSVRQAMKMFREAKDIFEKAGSRRGRGLVYINLGNMRRLIGDYQEALGFLSQARALFEDLGDEINLAEVLNEKGCVYRDQGKYQEAEEVLSESLELSRCTNDAFRMADNLEDLSEVYFQGGDLEKAEQSAQHARELARKHGYNLLASNCLRNLANVAFARGLFQEAFSLYAEACLTATLYSFPLYRQHLDFMESQCLELPVSEFDEVNNRLIGFWREKGMAVKYPEFIEKCECILNMNW